MSSRLKGGREEWREERIEGTNDDATEDTSTPIADRIDRDLPSHQTIIPCRVSTRVLRTCAPSPPSPGVEPVISST